MPQSAKANTAPKGKLAWTVRRVKTLPRPAQVAPLPMRRYHMSWLAPNGDIDSGSMTAPAVPLFEKTFNAFARGALIPTPMGLVAIEDLFPGDSVLTVDGTVEQIDWIGSMVLDLHGKRAPNAKPERLYRITSDAFGLGRPSPDLLLGAGALYCPQAGQVPGFGEQMRQVSLKFVPTAILSRQVAVIRELPDHAALIVNLPGQPKAIRETLEGLRGEDGAVLVPGIFEAVPYCLDLIGGPYVETRDEVVRSFRPKSARRPAS